MAAVDLDFREAQFNPGPTEVRVGALMGAVTITIPPDLPVECDGTSVLGHFESLASGPREAAADAPRLRISGRAVMGSVEIKVLRPGETSEA